MADWLLLDPGDLRGTIALLCGVAVTALTAVLLTMLAVRAVVGGSATQGVAPGNRST